LAYPERVRERFPVLLDDSVAQSFKGRASRGGVKQGKELGAKGRDFRLEPDHERPLQLLQQLRSPLRRVRSAAKDAENNVQVCGHQRLSPLTCDALEDGHLEQDGNLLLQRQGLFREEAVLWKLGVLSWRPPPHPQADDAHNLKQHLHLHASIDQNQQRLEVRPLLRRLQTRDARPDEGDAENERLAV
jgi:hypothetical protein